MKEKYSDVTTLYSAAQFFSSFMTSLLVSTVQLSLHVVNIWLLGISFTSAFLTSLALKLQCSELSESSVYPPHTNWRPFLMLTLIFRSMLDLKMLSEAKSLCQNKLTQPFITSAFNETENSAVPPVGRYNTCRGFSFWRRCGETWVELGRSCLIESRGQFKHEGHLTLL